MSWHEKAQATAFDAMPIPGLLNLHGDVLAQRYKQDWLKGKKYPLITFPSGLQRELSDSTTEGGIVNVFGGLDLLRHSTRNEAVQAAIEFAVEHDYTVGRRGEDELLIFHPHSGNGYSIKYDNRAKQMVDVKRIPAFAMDLLDGVSRAALPPLYSGEQAGLSAVAPVKFFTPDANWTWYPTEFDGENLFFGLVAGFEVELGYFALTELEGLQGGLGLPLERDLYYTPKTLRELQQLHRSA